MKLSVFAIHAATWAMAAARPATSAHVKHEKRGIHETARDIVARAEGDMLLPVRIAMTQSNLDEGHDILMDISRHDSPNYGKHLSAEEIHDLFAPSQDSVEALVDWLQSQGISKDRVAQSVNKQWLQFDAPVAELEKLLKTKYHIYEHSSGKMHVGCEEYSVPEHLVEHIDYITPGITRLGLKARSLKRDSVGRSAPHRRPPPISTPFSFPPGKVNLAGDTSLCDTVISPACIFGKLCIRQSTPRA